MVIFIRHPAVGATGICYGRLDLDCAPESGTAIAALLARLPPAPALRSSPSRRCRVLAERIAARDHVALEVDDRLRELDFGAWEGRRWADIDRGESDRWAADPWTVAPPGGETFALLHARVSAALADAPEGAVIVTHAGVIRAARMILTGTSFAQAFGEPVPYCAALRFADAVTQERLASAAKAQ